jgi:hypothetical protein
MVAFAANSPQGLPTPVLACFFPDGDRDIGVPRFSHAGMPFGKIVV